MAMPDDVKERSAMKLTLGQYLASIRTDRRMTLRQVEQATNKEVSNAYLSQIENDKIRSRRQCPAWPRGNLSGSTTGS